jgi:hypothetical protein
MSEPADRRPTASTAKQIRFIAGRMRFASYVEWILRGLALAGGAYMGCLTLVATGAILYSVSSSPGPVDTSPLTPIIGVVCATSVIILWASGFGAAARFFGTRVIARCIDDLRLSGHAAAVGPLLEARAYGKVHLKAAEAALSEIIPLLSEADSGHLTRADRRQIYGALLEADTGLVAKLLPGVGRTGGRLELEVVEIIAGRKTSPFLPDCREPEVQAAAELACQAITARMETDRQRQSLLRASNGETESLLRPSGSADTNRAQLLRLPSEGESSV